ncbi:MAG: hypothetical protein HY367_02415 [Candidatus Aenigmarchaeota archaeon]|nr:hypothetical protein [Candidatus Aenigmarchaeota archaeon]
MSEEGLAGRLERFLSRYDVNARHEDYTAAGLLEGIHYRVIGGRMEVNVSPNVITAKSNVGDIVAFNASYVPVEDLADEFLRLRGRRDG